MIVTRGLGHPGSPIVTAGLGRELVAPVTPPALSFGHRAPVAPRRNVIRQQSRLAVLVVLTSEGQLHATTTQLAQQRTRTLTARRSHTSELHAARAVGWTLRTSTAAELTQRAAVPVPLTLTSRGEWNDDHEVIGLLLSLQRPELFALLDEVRFD